MAKRISDQVIDEVIHHFQQVLNDKKTVPSEDAKPAFIQAALGNDKFLPEHLQKALGNGHYTVKNNPLLKHDRFYSTFCGYLHEDTTHPKQPINPLF